MAEYSIKKLNLNAQYRYIKLNINCLRLAIKDTERAQCCREWREGNADFIKYQRGYCLRLIAEYENSGGRRDMAAIKKELNKHRAFYMEV